MDIATFLNSREGYNVTDTFVYFEDRLVARLFKKQNLYKFLKQINRQAPTGIVTASDTPSTESCAEPSASRRGRLGEAIDTYGRDLPF